MKEKIKSILKYLKCLIIIFALIFTSCSCLEILYNQYKTNFLLNYDNINITNQYSNYLENEFNYNNITIKEKIIPNNRITLKENNILTAEKTIQEAYKNNQRGTVLLLQQIYSNNDNITKILIIFEISVIVSLAYYFVTKSKKNQIKKLLISNSILTLTLLFINDRFNNSNFVEDEQILFSITIISILACILLKLKDKLKKQKTNIDIIDKIYIIVIILSPLSYFIDYYQLTLLIISISYLILLILIEIYKYIKSKYQGVNYGTKARTKTSKKWNIKNSQKK